MIDTAEETRLCVIALHDLRYRERLFYLTEVEGIQNPTALIYAGRRLHVEVVSSDDETPEHRSFEVARDRWGLMGRSTPCVGAMAGGWPSSTNDAGDRPEVWPSDHIQAVAYAVLVEEALGETVPQARVRYHADGVKGVEHNRRRSVGVWVWPMPLPLMPKGVEH